MTGNIQTQTQTPHAGKITTVNYKNTCTDFDTTTELNIIV